MKRKMKIKICGIRREEDIDIVNQFLPDFIGFILVPQSKRYVSPETIIKLKKNLNPKIKTVGVFVNESLENINTIKEKCGLDVIQLHGEESSKFCNAIQGDVWKTIGVNVDDNTFRLSPSSYSPFTDLILLDSHVSGERGGTGTTFDWSIIDTIPDEINIGLAGGININNVASAKKITGLSLIDIASGSETNGVKDINKIKAIIKEIKEDFYE
ncbi:MAG: phosphoribosylanthranilate isomerase [Fusobacteriaceae bacterium]